MPRIELIDENTEPFKYSNMSSSNILKNIKHLLKPHPYGFTYDIECNVSIEHNNYPEISINNLGDVSIRTDYRDTFYTVNVIIFDDLYKDKTILNVHLFDIQEIEPISTIISDSYLTLSNTTELFNIESLFEKNNQSGFVVYDCNVVDLSRYYRHYGLNEYITELQDSTLRIYSDYRNDEYMIYVYAYIQGYEEQRRESIIHVRESNIPSIDDISLNIKFSNLIQNTVSCNLDNIFSSYPYYTELKHTLYMKDNEDSKTCNIVELSRNAQFSGDARADTYDIYLRTEDRLFNISNVDNIFFTIHEEPPFYIIQSYPSIPTLNAVEYYIENITSFYNINVSGGILRYDLELSNLDEPVSDVVNYLVEEDSLEIFPRYRNRTYGIIITPYVVGYDNYKDVSTTILVEETYNPINIDAQVCNITITDSTVIRQLREDLGVNSDFDLKDIYDISCNLFLQTPYENSSSSSPLPQIDIVYEDAGIKQFNLHQIIEVLDII